jgi:hypothetical protein
MVGTRLREKAELPPRTVERRPEVLSGPSTVTAVEPDKARRRAR